MNTNIGSPCVRTEQFRSYEFRENQILWIVGEHQPNIRPVSRLSVKIAFLSYGDSHVKDKTVARPSYL